jgi:hypothetical protein
MINLIEKQNLNYLTVYDYFNNFKEIVERGSNTVYYKI